MSALFLLGDILLNADVLPPSENNILGKKFVNEFTVFWNDGFDLQAINAQTFNVCVLFMFTSFIFNCIAFLPGKIINKNIIEL